MSEELLYKTPADLMNAICSAVREKDGTTDEIAYQDLPQRVLDIPSGGSESNRLYLYKDGDECIDVTGGWTNENREWTSTDEKHHAFYSKPTKDNYSILLLASNGLCGCGTVNKINLSKYNRVKALVRRYQGNWHPSIFINTDLHSNKNTRVATASLTSSNSTTYKTYLLEIDISTLEDEYYINMHMDSYDYGTRNVEFSSIWLEK